MSDFNPEIVRAVAIETKSAVADLYADLMAVYAVTSHWTLHCTNAALPDPYSVRVAVEQYQALKTNIRTLEQRTWIELMKTAQPDDGLSIMDPCDGSGSGIFDGSATFDGGTVFDGGA